MFCAQIRRKVRAAPGTISHHLKILADGNLMGCRREGQSLYNRSQPETIREYGRALTKLAGKQKPPAEADG
jgi:hypothetical protein